MEIVKNLDHSLFQYFYQITGQNHWQDKILIFLAVYLIYAIPVILIVVWFWSKDSKKVALKATAAGILAWLFFCNLIGAIWYRARPFVAQANVEEVLFHRPNRSFPSDHSAFLFALAFAFWLLGYKKLGVGIFILSVVISVTRIIVGVHYPADIVAGFVIGFLAAVLIWYLQKPLDKIFEPMIGWTKKIRLA